eukprot:8684562-Pyramimonas_sp.AAC.1
MASGGPQAAAMISSASCNGVRSREDRPKFTTQRGTGSAMRRGDCQRAPIHVALAKDLLEG